MSKFGDALTFENQVASVLEGSGLDFQQNAAIEGLSPDFAAVTPDGGKILIDLKTWEPTKTNLARAARQVKQSRAATGEKETYIVIKDLPKSRPKDGLLSLDDLPGAVTSKVESAGERTSDAPGISKVESVVFAAMPFAGVYDDVYYVAMTHAAKSVNSVCKRVNEEEFSGDIVEKIQSLIRGSIAVIADLSESKPNVLYEIGFAHALKLPTAHICSTDLAQLPFDVRNWNTISYTKGQTTQLQEPLSKRLKALLTGKA
jgi:hypothetical protein